MKKTYLKAPVEALAKGMEGVDISEMEPAEVLKRLNVVAQNPSANVEIIDSNKQMFNNNARDEFIIRYHSAGMTPSTIEKMVKAKAQEKGWRPVNENTIRAITVEYYKKRRELIRGVDGKENEMAMREAALDQQEKFLERLVMCYDKHDKKPASEGGFKNMFDRVQLATLITTARQQYIENKNWNDSRKNPTVIAESTVFEVNLFDKTGEKMLANGKSEAMENVLDHLRKKFDNSNALDQDYVEADYQEDDE